MRPEEAFARPQEVEPGRRWFMASVAELSEPLITQLNDLHILVFAAVNTHHYPPESALQAGLEDLRRALTWPLAGIQLDSLYSPALA